MNYAAIIVAIFLFIPVINANAQLRPLDNPASPAAPPEDGKPTLWLVGDSTAKNGARGEKGWGEVIGKMFDLSKIHVENHAIGGRSSRIFITEGRWDFILNHCHPGDFVLVQLGTNDGNPINDNSRARGTIRGVGDNTEEIENQLTGKHEVVHTFGWYMRKFVKDSVAKKMTPILCTIIPHCPREIVHKGDLEKSDYVRFTQQVADQEQSPFIQLNGLILNRYAGMDPADIKAKYYTPADNTHTSPAGAQVNAECVVEGIQTTKGCEELAKYLRPFPAATQSSTSPR